MTARPKPSRAASPLAIEHGVSLARLHPDPANARKHGERNMQAIVASLKEHGQVEPLVVQRSSGRIIGGNGRFEAMRLLGWHQCLVAWVDIGDLAATKLGITLNRSAELAEWDLDTLDTLLAGLEDHDVDVGDLGFTADELDDLLGAPDDAAGAVDPDDDLLPDLPYDPITEAGDVWVLGKHRLMCGDSRDPEQVERLVCGVGVDLIFTDPPYGMGLDTNFDGSFSRDPVHRKTGKRHAAVAGDDAPFDASPLLEAFPKVPEVVLFGADYYRRSLPDGGSWFVWDKRCDDNMDRVAGNVFELAWSRAKRKREVCRLLWSGHHGMQADDTKTRVHPTQKPVALVQWFFERIPGAVVLDLYAGSGSTLVACERMNRQALCMELMPAYVDVIVARWEKLTGGKAKRAG